MTSPNGKNSIQFVCTDDLVGIFLSHGSKKKEVSIYINEGGAICFYNKDNSMTVPEVAISENGLQFRTAEHAMPTVLGE